MHTSSYLRVKNDLKMTRDHNLSFLWENMRNCICTYHMEEITGTLLYIYRNCFILEIEPSGWKGSVPYGLGADISLPPWLATGIWNLVPKATSGPKSRGASLGTKLWRHVQRYCAQFLAFMVIYGNSVLWVFCLCNRKYPRISNGNRVIGRVISHFKIILRARLPQNCTTRSPTSN